MSRYLKIFLLISILFFSCAEEKFDVMDIVKRKDRSPITGKKFEFKYEEINTKDKSILGFEPEDEVTIGLKIIDKNGKVRKTFIYKDEEGYPFGGIYRCLEEIDLTGDGKKEIVISYYSLGAHCCYEYFILTPKNGKFEEIGHFKFGNAEITEFKDLDRDGIVEIIGDDDRLAYHFLPFAFTPFLPRIIHFEKGKFVECTTKYPKVLKKEAREYEDDLRLYSALWKRELGYRLGMLDKLRIITSIIVYFQKEDIEGKNKSLFERIKIMYQNLKEEIFYKPDGSRISEFVYFTQRDALGMLSIYIWLGRGREGIKKVEEIVKDIKKPVDMLSWLRENRIELRNILYMEDRDEIEGFMWGTYMENIKEMMKELEKTEEFKETIKNLKK